jgi:hypothetical protein
MAGGGQTSEVRYTELETTTYSLSDILGLSIATSDRKLRIQEDLFRISTSRPVPGNCLGDGRGEQELHGGTIGTGPSEVDKVTSTADVGLERRKRQVEVQPPGVVDDDSDIAEQLQPASQTRIHEDCW